MRLAAIFTVCWAIATATPSAFAQQSIDLGSVSGRVTDQSGAVVIGREGQRPSDANQPDDDHDHGSGRALSPPVPSGGRVRDHGAGSPASRTPVRDLTLTAGAAFELPVTLSVAAVDANVTVTADATVARSRPQPDCGTMSEAEVQQPADERPQLPRPRAARAGRVADQRRAARSCSRKRRPCPASGSRSAASATSRTTSSSTACRRTTMPPG